MSPPIVYDFKELCTPHYETLVKYATRLTGRPQEAKDLVQEAFLKAVRLWHTWSPKNGEEPVGAARGWLHSIVRNLFIDQVRAASGHRKLLDDHHDRVVEFTYGVEVDHNEQVVSDGIGDEVRDALDSLDQDQREVVERADFGGEQYMAIAEALGVPIGTVMSRLHRARKRLAGSLRSYAKEEYGIALEKPARRPRLARGTESDCSGSAALADVPSKAPETEADSIDTIMRGDDDSDLFGCEPGFDTESAG